MLDFLVQEAVAKSSQEEEELGTSHLFEYSKTGEEIPPPLPR
jgi:hypothetical protein